jgi:alpha-galactosidase
MPIPRHFLFLILFLTVISSCKPHRITNGNLLIEINKRMETKVNSNIHLVKPFMDDFSPSEYLVCKRFDAKQFARGKTIIKKVSDQRGSGNLYITYGIFNQGEYDLEKILEIIVYDSFPDMAFYRLQYINKGQRDIEVLKWVNNSYSVLTTGDNPAFWSFQGSSTNMRRDWILPVDSAFCQRNFLGMNDTDYGGGIPLIDLWRKDGGIAIGHSELIPQLVSLPVEKNRYDNWSQISVVFEFQEPRILKQGDTLKTITTFVSVHTGDCYASLQSYSKFMQASGIKLAPVEPEAYEAVWCAWGYMRKFTMDEITGTLPKVKQLGIRWVDIDDGYQQAEGDWNIAPTRFPNGERDMRVLTDKIHAMGLKAKLWWAPLAADPCSQLLQQNPDLIQWTRDGAPQFITWWDSYYMSPVYQKTIDHTRSVIKMFLSDWNFDGLKMDGQHLNCVHPDYHPQHQLKYPEQANEKLPQFFEMIYKTARSIKPHAVLQICPCGCAMSFFNMPWTNQTVASDPTSSWQTRLKGKTYKALLGKTAYYGDHVEMIDGGDDFASQVGIGAVLGTKFTWPKDNPYVTEGHFVLTPEKEKKWKKWISIYNQKMLSKENYKGNLYDLGYDKPETHVIQKADTLFYAFFHKKWEGEIELRGLENRMYFLKDYVNNVDYGNVNGPVARIKANFSGSLLLEASPVR